MELEKISEEIGILKEIGRTDFSSFYSILFSKIEPQHVKYLVVDLSTVPHDEKIEYLGILYGFFSGHDIITAYIGIEKKTVKKEDWGIHTEAINSSIHKTLEEAIASIG